jgi:hypothetical protein
MAVTEITSRELLQQVRRASGLPVVMDNHLDEALLAALIRRAAGFLCPCSRATVAAAVVESLEFIADTPETLRERIDAAIEALIAFGDLLELNQVTIDDPEAKGTWIFAAPPGFVKLRSGTVLLLGISRDESTPLPSELSDQVIYNRFARLLPAGGKEQAAALAALGLTAHTEEAWTRGPQSTTAQALVEKLVSRLASWPPSGDLPELTFIRPDTDTNYYRGRWGTPRNETGMFVGRRPQDFGREGMWGVVQLASGTPTKFLDLPSRSRWRGCDEAWYVQLALDATRRSPQKYRVRSGQDGPYLDFFSPIPSWAERRLAIVGEPAPRVKSLFSYRVPQQELKAQEDYLQKNLWLVRLDDKNGAEG